MENIINYYKDIMDDYSKHNLIKYGNNLDIITSSYYVDNNNYYLIYNIRLKCYKIDKYIHNMNIHFRNFTFKDFDIDQSKIIFTDIDINKTNIIIKLCKININNLYFNTINKYLNFTILSYLDIEYEKYFLVNNDKYLYLLMIKYPRLFNGLRGLEKRTQISYDTVYKELYKDRSKNCIYKDNNLYIFDYYTKLSSISYIDIIIYNSYLYNINKDMCNFYYKILPYIDHDEIIMYHHDVQYRFIDIYIQPYKCIEYYYKMENDLRSIDNFKTGMPFLEDMGTIFISEDHILYIFKIIKEFNDIKIKSVHDINFYLGILLHRSYIKTNILIEFFLDNYLDNPYFEEYLNLIQTNKDINLDYPIYKDELLELIKLRKNEKLINFIV